MSLPARMIIASVLIGIIALGSAIGIASNVAAATPRVVMVDNDAPPPNQGVNFWQGEWGFAPHHVAVAKGEPVVFDNPAGNSRAHNVVSVSRPGAPTEPALEAGSKFNSGFAREAWIQPGASWTLDTSALEPGQYSYVCLIHPWMNGSVTVLPTP